ncbi:MAG TPA: hypothetical protein PKE64_00515 [Anaerolineae bacterium]|nr:hypothetical protein [Anaerolineae bacterium]
MPKHSPVSQCGMFNPFIPPDQIILEDTPGRLVLARPNRLRLFGLLALGLALVTLLVTAYVGLSLGPVMLAVFYLGTGLLFLNTRSTIVFDQSHQQLYFVTNFLGLERHTRFAPFQQIDKVYLDYEEQPQPGTFSAQEQLQRRWYIYLSLNGGETQTLVQNRANHHLEALPNLSKETRAWESIAQKICDITGKLLVRMPTVPGHAPRTFVEVIDQIVQRRLASLPAEDPLRQQTIRLRSHPSGNLEIVVTGVTYGRLDEIADEPARNLIQAAIDEWRGPEQNLPQLGLE